MKKIEIVNSKGKKYYVIESGMENIKLVFTKKDEISQGLNAYGVLMANGEIIRNGETIGFIDKK